MRETLLDVGRWVLRSINSLDLGWVAELARTSEMVRDDSLVLVHAIS